MLIIDRSVGSKDLASHPLLQPISVLDDLVSAGGDIVFSGNGPHGDVTFAIELKSVGDLLKSMISGRLQGIDGQIPKMMKSYDVNYLLIYGEYKLLPDSLSGLVYRDDPCKGWRQANRPYSYLESFLMGLTDAGIRVHRVLDIESAVGWILACHNRYSRPWDSHKIFRVLQKHPPPVKVLKSSNAFVESVLDSARKEDLSVEVKQIMKTASSFDNVSYERALRIAQRFRSVKDMINATFDEWMEVKGIGKVIARQMVETMKRERM